MRVPYFDSASEYIDFLESTLIPDLMDSGKRRMAQDFQEAVYWLGIESRRGVKSSILTSRTKTKRKRTQSPKQKLLKQMTDKKWKVYKKGSGKKTYIQIRGEVSRSQAYKKKAKRL